MFLLSSTPTNRRSSHVGVVCTCSSGAGWYDRFARKSEKKAAKYRAERQHRERVRSDINQQHEGDHSDTGRAIQPGVDVESKTRWGTAIVEKKCAVAQTPAIRALFWASITAASEENDLPDLRCAWGTGPRKRELQNANEANMEAKYYAHAYKKN